MTMWHFISEKISEALDIEFVCDDIREISGGDTHSSFKISNDKKRFFVKINSPDTLPQFEAEIDGLSYLNKTELFFVPHPICSGIIENKSYLVLEYISMQEGTKDDWFTFGQQLARMHQQWTSDTYGWHINNFIGLTPQLNTPCQSWAEFFVEYRIRYLMKMLQKQGYSIADINDTCKCISSLLHGHTPQSSLVHGDLWSGNVAFHKAHPVLFDPAIYYGDRETDIAMTELFGGFNASFYKGYNATYPLDEEYKLRKPIYQFYHILNHALLFGGHYLENAKSIIRQLRST